MQQDHHGYGCISRLQASDCGRKFNFAVEDLSPSHSSTEGVIIGI